MYPKSIQKLIDLFSKFPTVGPRTASRFVFYLIQKPSEEIDEIINAISNLKRDIKVCASCFKPFQGEPNLCEICSHPSRNKTLLCIVEKEIDLETIEKTKKYQGLYFILGGTISTLKKADDGKIRIKKLEEKIKNSPEIKEIIIALNPTAEGETTALYLERILKPLDKKTSRLGRGLPVGGELEYADEETIASALASRK